METTGENGGSFAVDLNENEEIRVCGGGGGLAGKKPYIREHGRALLDGVSGGQEAGKGHIYVTGNGRNVNSDSSVQPHTHKRDIMLDLVTGEKYLPEQLTDSCVVSGVCEDHGGLNGFTESLCEDEPTMIGLEGGGGGVRAGEGEGGGPGLAGTTAASCRAVLGARVSEETDRGVRQQPAGEREGEHAESEDVTPVEVSAGCIGTSAILDRMPCTGRHQQDCACTAADLSGPDVNMPNGDVDSTGSCDPEADLSHCRPTGMFSSQQLDERHGLCDVDCEEVKVANGGLHIVTTARDSYDWPDSDYLPENNTDTDLDLGLGQENGAGLEECLGSRGASSGTSVLQCPVEDAPASAEHNHSTDSPAPSPDEDSLPLGSSAKPPSPCPSPYPNVNGDSPLSEPNIREDEEDFSDLSLPVRPVSLRTNPNLAVSLSCDATPLSPDDDGGFYFGDEGYEGDLWSVLDAGRRQSAPDKLPDLTDQTDSSDPKLMPKRFGIADFFTRSLFSRKPKEPKALSHNATGWRLFGKTPSREGDQTKDPTSTVSTEQEEEEEEEQEQEESGESSCAQLPLSAGRRKNLEFEPLSTTALILEDRPANLPAKSLEETQRHKMEYEEMVAGAKRRELKEAQRKKRQMKERHRQEDIISNAMVIWNSEILPNWDTMKGTRRVRDLWWQGLPPSVRGRVWSLAIGNELNITPELYEIFLSRAKEKWRSYSETSSVNDNESDGGASLADRESSLDLIKLDISRTFPSLFIFQKGGPYHDLLHSVLGAYTCYRPDIGYVQGMSFIAAVLILNLEEAEAFITFANLLNKPCQMAFFRVDHELMLKYFAAFEVFFEENLPRLFNHFQTNNLTPDLYLIDWIFTLYSKSLPLDVACRVWDVFCRDGEESLFRTGLGILRLFEEVLLQMDFIHIAQFLTRLPEDLQSHTLFSAMANTHMISRNRRWAQVFSALMKDGTKESEKNTSPALRS
ncbi:TBC1 domain family member 12 isoform X2 [Notolabrus celidotus]|uniref:TBC1 domain family member 12 isoform X2 n=1 Tax=Notolabrus celidotus TaxID=1203425 RepID=UPI0014901B80|nr:TBC1 domain family member 12 isoform X2 [Notolabrus celidotus]